MAYPSDHDLRRSPEPTFFLDFRPFVLRLPEALSQFWSDVYEYGDFSASGYVKVGSFWIGYSPDWFWILLCWLRALRD
ncbi:hypothetical protein MRB53_022929 [Persea americana]|uniref:Uncharacterized protein n=1 Tax=Persea americana TaxID=3435 RepID=A0ACC2L7V1_PERAE|nr:hypothetical protein MRB53_022929 [Persea americana]